MRGLFAAVFIVAALWGGLASAKPANIAETQVELTGTAAQIVAARSGRQFVSLVACQQNGGFSYIGDSAVTTYTGFPITPWTSGTTTPMPQPTVIQFEGAVYGVGSGVVCAMEVY